MPTGTPRDPRPRSRPTTLGSLLRSRALLCGGLGFGFGLGLTFTGYLVDYYFLYKRLPDPISFSIIRGLHEITPVHFFMDGFALILAVVGTIVGRLQDRLIYHSNHLEELVAERTRDLLRSQERYELAARGANDGLWDWDLPSGKVYYSARWRKALGDPEDGREDTPGVWLDRVHAEDRPGLEARIQGHLSGGTTHLDAEYRIRHADGSYRWMLSRGMAVRDEATGRPYRLAGSQTDIDERKRMEEQLMHLALHDPLTRLPNRTLFFDRLAQAFGRARKRGKDESLAIVFVDIDRFKNINDSLGHVVGDEVLQVVADRFRSCVERVAGELGQQGAEERRQTRRRGIEWTIARMGGDEFTVLLENVASIRDATQVVGQLEEQFRKPVQIAGRELYVTLSTGVVLGPGEYERPEELMRDADTAMYRAKAGGRARCEIFDEKMLARVQEELRLETSLHRALPGDEFHVVYQPIVELESGRLRGFEALLRWRHPERGLIPPAKFIPMAEETGLIIPLGRWLFTEACRQLRHWHDLDPKFQCLTLATNLSLRQIYSPELVDEVTDMVNQAGLDPALLHFEITENTLIEHPAQVTKVLLRLKRNGFKVAIDDFGTGYSSLAALESLPVDVLKMDQVFVARMGETEKARQIVATIISLAGALGHEIIAEGIETEEQLKELKKLGCALGQGHHFSEALAGDEVETELLTRFYSALGPAGREPRIARRAV
ncbi:MAG TPA: EAL domain-containing protein [Patescibacteria group bacterium]|nr:EAL domain-containing protein [Patescibacteria group bacterium]